MVRPSYRANLAGDEGQAFFGMIFDPSQEGAVDHDLRGSCRAPRRFVGWQTFFDFGDGEVKPNKLIDTRLSTRYSTCRSARSLRLAVRPHWLSATCSVTSPGNSRLARVSPRP